MRGVPDGQAFPVSLVGTPAGDIHHSGQVVEGGAGMSLRDFFAAHALSSSKIMDGAYNDSCETNGMNADERVALRAYRVADAMLKERMIPR